MKHKLLTLLAYSILTIAVISIIGFMIAVAVRNPVSGGVILLGISTIWAILYLNNE